MNCTVIYQNAAGSGIDLEIARFDWPEFRLFRARAAEIGADARQEFLHAERLGDVIVGARIQRLNLSPLLTAHREHDDGNLRLRPQMAAQFQAVHVGHGQVGDDHIRRPVFHDLERRFAVVGNADVVSVAGQRSPQHPRDLGFIVDYENVFMVGHDG